MKNGFRVMDSDLHTMEPDNLWDRYLEKPYRNRLPQFTHEKDWASHVPLIKMGELSIGDYMEDQQSLSAESKLQDQSYARHNHLDHARSRAFDSETHVQAMDIEGVDLGVLYGTRGRQILQHDDLPPDYAAAVARAHNRWTHDFCQYNPERLKFAAQIAMHDVGLAVEEVRYSVEELGAIGVVGNPNPVNGRHIHDPYFDPLWDTLEDLDVPLGIHPTGLTSLRDNITSRFVGALNGYAIGRQAHNPIELMLAFSSLALGGVFERHPTLKVAFLEGTAGWLPWWLWRMDEHWELMGPGFDTELSKLPSACFARQCWIATDPDEAGLHRVIDAIGNDRIVISTDYSHSDGLFPEATNEFLSLEKLSEESQRRILWNNCASLYNHG